MQDNPSPLNEIFEDQQIHLNFGGQEILASVAFTSPFGLGEIAGIYVAQNIPLSKEFIKTLLFQSKKIMFLFHHKVIMSFTKMEN